MYEYRVVPVGDVRALRRNFDKKTIAVVEDGNGTVEEAMQKALDELASEGWKLHTCLAAGGPGPRSSQVTLIFERITRESAKKLMAALEPGVVP